MAFDVCHADVEIGKGLAELKNVYVNSSAARLVARGKVSLKGNLDIAITTYLMPGLEGMVKEVSLASSLMKTVGGFLLIPVDIRIRGPVDDPHYYAMPVPGHLLKAGGGLIKGVVGGVVKGGTSFVEDTMTQGPVDAVGTRLKKGGAMAVDTVVGTGKLVGNTVDETDKALGKGADKVMLHEKKDAEEETGFLRGLFGGRKKGKGGDGDDGKEPEAGPEAAGQAAPAGSPAEGTAPLPEPSANGLAPPGTGAGPDGGGPSRE